MKKSDVKKVIEKICFAYDMLSNCYCVEDLKTLCRDDEKLLFRLNCYDCSDHMNFLRARDFVVEGVLESIMRECAILS